MNVHTSICLDSDTLFLPKTSWLALAGPLHQIVHPSSSLLWLLLWPLYKNFSCFCWLSGNATNYLAMLPMPAIWQCCQYSDSTAIYLTYIWKCFWLFLKGWPPIKQTNKQYQQSQPTASLDWASRSELNWAELSNCHKSIVFPHWKYYLKLDQRTWLMSCPTTCMLGGNGL